MITHVYILNNWGKDTKNNQKHLLIQKKNVYLQAKSIHYGLVRQISKHL